MAKMSEVADWVGWSAPAGDAEIDRVSSIEAATGSSVVFAVDSTALRAAIESKAGLILAAKSSQLEDDRIWHVADARYAFATIARRLKGKGFEAGIHPSAVVGEDVQIGAGTSIGPGVVIGEGVRIGKDCNIMARVTLYPRTVLGDRVVAQAGAVLGSTGFGYVRHAETGEYLVFPQQGSLCIEDDVEIGANSTIDRGALGETRIGRGTKIDNLVHIGHNCVIGKNVIIAAQTGISGSSVVEDGAILGGQVGIGEHATVGAGVILGGGAGVLSGKKMRGPGQVFWGRPARPLKEYLRDLARLRKG
ncbi:MAG TPA: UDP-3-O-(3-hydroxymyristoyl)glucosamine N-acyltransferase [Edaphobacter sp.]|uniref:UDP-3-O-(3-hydroxymyristoyl)glucosamine N-acyltransferase n=1 Tax=Edaphobacter sp. TaxID=1934404 RepID=UPI002C098585|nr:UDP-3-O-(3-hydroxymyristoyl)glucosamine N-acyltransferase [Edaphobacter sp.]HUZ96463.1 UDP-3-O-(3-hydroxymyristoyl)glucosamine N-acyltransferase [Edaphobacter sp.]